MTAADPAEGHSEPATDPSEVDDWLDLIDYLTGEAARRNQALECEFEDVRVDVPMSMRSDAETANWRLDGGVTMSVGEVRVPLRDWMQYWERGSD